MNGRAYHPVIGRFISADPFQFMKIHEEPEIKVRFVVTSSLLTPEEISKYLEVQASKTWLEGEKVHPGATKQFDENGWVIFESAVGAGASAERLVAKIFDAIPLPKLKKLRAENPEIEFELSIIVAVTNRAPVVSLSTSQIKYLAEIEAEIDVDIYPMGA
jgi:hypothetical protein